jgi:hypothetical protein
MKTEAKEIKLVNFLQPNRRFFPVVISVDIFHPHKPGFCKMTRQKPEMKEMKLVLFHLWSRRFTPAIEL